MGFGEVALQEHDILLYLQVVRVLHLFLILPADDVGCVVLEVLHTACFVCRAGKTYRIDMHGGRNSYTSQEPGTDLEEPDGFIDLVAWILIMRGHPIDLCAPLNLASLRGAMGRSSVLAARPDARK